MDESVINIPSIGQIVDETGPSTVMMTISKPQANPSESEETIIIKEENDVDICGPFYGKCKWFSDKSGYGFITIGGYNTLRKESDELSPSFAIGKEIFVHFTGIKTLNSTYKTLISGEYVCFDIVKGTRDFQAISVTGINGGPLMCDSNPETRHIIPKSNQVIEDETKQKKNHLVHPIDKNKILGKYDGRCKWFNDRSGYGFLVIDSGDSMGKDVFVHYTGIDPIHSSYKTLISGEYLTFNTINGVKDIQAIDVTGYRGGSMMCDTNHCPKMLSVEDERHHADGKSMFDRFGFTNHFSTLQHKPQRNSSLPRHMHLLSTPPPPPPPRPPPPPM